MRKFFLVIFLSLAVLPLPGSVSAVDKDWDGILDKYEFLCGSCLQLKLKAEAGEKVSRTEFSKLFSALAQLRSELKDGAGSMTEIQLQRFERIRSRYSAVFGETSAAERKPAQFRDQTQAKTQAVGRKSQQTEHPASPTAQKSASALEPVSAPASRAAQLPSPKPVPALKDSLSECMKALPCLDLSASGRAVQYSGTPTILREIRTDIPEVEASHRRLYGSVAYVMAVWPVLSYGASLSLFDNDTRWGGYAKFHSNFKPVAHSYLCSSDGSWDGGVIWSSGKTSVSCLHTSAGVRKNFGKWFGITAGAGYGRKVVLWEDVSGEWAKVKDLSTSGLLLECGFIFDAGPVEIQAGVSTISFRTVSLELGVGFLF